MKLVWRLLVAVALLLIAVPATQVGLDADIPQVSKSSRPQAASDSEKIVAELTADRKLTVNKQAVDVDKAEEFFRELFRSRTDKTLFVSAAGQARYGEVMRIIQAAQSAGVRRIGILTAGMKKEAEIAPSSAR
jgi:biopolymer transport protein ExbD